MNWLVSYCTARLILVTWSRPNLIIELIFPVGKKWGNKILFSVLQIYGFLFTKLPIRISYRPYSLNSRDLFLNLRRLVKMTKPLRFENKSLRLKFKCLICIWIIFWAILDLFINPKYLFQNKSFSQTYYFKSEKSFVILTSLLGLKINPVNLESRNTWEVRQLLCSSIWLP